MESGKTAMLVLNILEEEGLKGSRLIFVHADSEEILEYHLKAARRGAWIEYDRINQQTADRTLKLIKFIVEHGFENQLLLSQDSGWYSIDNARGRTIRGYDYLVKSFIPLMQKRGFNQNFINKIVKNNPASAFQIE